MLLLGILAIDGFRTLFESIYFGLYQSSFYGLMLPDLYGVLSQPGMLLIPKLVNAATAVVILFVLVRRWIPIRLDENKKREQHLEAVTAKLKDSEARYRSLFENADIALWNEDMTELYKALQTLRHEGVTDIYPYLQERPDKAWELAALIKVRHVNLAVIRMFKAAEEDDLLKGIASRFGPGAIEVFIEEVIAIWDKHQVFRSEATFRTLDGGTVDALLSFQIPETPEAFQAVCVSMVDITARKRQEMVLQGAAQDGGSGSD